MYRINQTGRPTLITPDEVIAKIASDSTIEVRMILQNIEVAEERIIVDAIGNGLYEELIAAKNREVTEANRADLLSAINASIAGNGNPALTTANLPAGTLINASEFLNTAQLALWNRFLWRVTAEAVDLMCTVPSWLRHTNTGQLNNSPKVIGGNGENAASGDRGDVKFKMDVQLQQRINPLVDRMQGWMRTNGTHTFFGWEPACDTTEAPRRNTGGFVFGVYDNDTSRCGCGCGKRRNKCEGGYSRW